MPASRIIHPEGPGCRLVIVNNTFFKLDDEYFGVDIAISISVDFLFCILFTRPSRLFRRNSRMLESQNVAQNQ